MASSSFNVLLGAAALPDASRGRQVVIGTADDTTFFGGSTGIAVSAAGVSLAATATITASGETGALGQILTSEGLPYWATSTQLLASGAGLTLSRPLAQIYSVYGPTSWDLTLPAASSAGAQFWLKNYSPPGAVSAGNALVPLGAVTPGVAAMSTGQSSAFLCDGQLWYQLGSPQVVVAPGAPTSPQILFRTQFTRKYFAVSWGVPTTGSTATDYHWRIEIGGSVIGSGSTPGLSAEFYYEFNIALIYTLIVYASNSAGDGPAASASTNFIPPQPGNVTIARPDSANPASLIVSWNAVAGINSYVVNIYKNSILGPVLGSSTTPAISVLNSWTVYSYAPSFTLTAGEPFYATVVTRNGSSTSAPGVSSASGLYGITGLELTWLGGSNFQVAWTGALVDYTLSITIKKFYEGTVVVSGNAQTNAGLTILNWTPDQGGNTLQAYASDAITPIVYSNIISFS
ncbi:MAG: hypothetical protein EBU46_18440 [Nitrosomonadaceae bacterium]|nr:hypothetical protein [Nitrosomonadaceae bacterium]